MTFTSDKRREGGEVMSDKVTPEAVKAVLDALVGPTAARADTILDEESQANVPKFEDDEPGGGPCAAHVGE